jgi:uncharacterized protein YndB with AHSA1/START domain
VTEPIELDFTLGCAPEHAFDVWTCRATMWWPSAHTVSRREGVVVTFEPFAGGRIFERTPEGSEHDWGRIVAWDPPRRLAYTWHIATEPANATDVEITFAPEGERTRVHVRHDGWDRLGDLGPGWCRTNRLGWSGVVPDYRRAAEHRR